MSALKRNEPIQDLLSRSGMDRFKFNTRVIQSTDGKFRVQVSNAIENAWGDCIGIGVMMEDSPPYWYFAHFSPARARLIAYHLLEHAKLLERSDPGMRRVSTEDDCDNCCN